MGRIETFSFLFFFFSFLVKKIRANEIKVDEKNYIIIVCTEERVKSTYHHGAHNARPASATGRTQRRHRPNASRSVVAPTKFGSDRRVRAKRLSRAEDTFIARQSD